MATNKHVLFSLPFLLLLLLSLFFPIIHSSRSCNIISTCGNDNIPIRFPFHLKNRSPEGCGYPGFGLGCNAKNQTTLSLPNSGEFLVRQIIYTAQEILIYDPLNCLPNRLLSLDLSASPFSSEHYQNYTFLRCPAPATKSRYDRIECLSNSTYSVLATSSASVAATMNRSCQVMATPALPAWRQLQFEEGFEGTLGGDLRLTWLDPDCSACEIQGGMCGLKKNGTHEDIGCYFSRGGRFNSGLQIFRIICLSIAVPAVTCAFGIACFACYVDRTGPSHARRRGPNAVAAAPDSGPMTVGLDETTIESYQKLVLGESRRLPGPNDTTCPICLSEYRTKETLRCIPECKHCFHAECIDEWLRLNGTCPICRNTPSASPSPAHLDSSSVSV